MNESKKIKAILFWEGFPVCGLLIKKVADKLGDNLIIMATRSQVPFTELENILGHEIIYLDNANDIWKYKDKYADRNLIIHTGWTYSGWLKYDRYMKKHTGAKVVSMIDNRYRGDLRQWIGALWFRLYLRKHFDACLVPGKEAQKLMKFLGMRPERIYTGLYGAYEGIFKETIPIENRNKEFLFVGQLNKRKSIDILIEAFKNYRGARGKWTLRIIGGGPLADICHGDGIILEEFAEPDEIAKKMNRARVFVLPSRDDNWGTVVCEAATCGMHIISTNTAGASADIIQDSINGTILEEINSTDLQKAFFYFEHLPENILKEGSKISKEIASGYDSTAYSNAFFKIARDLS